MRGHISPRLGTFPSTSDKRSLRRGLLGVLRTVEIYYDTRLILHISSGRVHGGLCWHDQNVINSAP